MAREADSGAADASQTAATLAVAEQRRFKVALSFSGEQLVFVEAVAQALASTFGRNAVFFYPWYQHETNGIGALSQQVPDFYLKHADLTASFISASYERSNPCMAEWRAVREVIYTRLHSRLMLFRFDQTPMEGLHSYDCYTEVPGPGPQEIAQLLIKRWWLNQGLQAAEKNGSEAYLGALRSVIGERALGLVKSGPLEKLSLVGGFLRTPSAISTSPDISSLILNLKAATKACFPVWREAFGKSLDLVRENCRMLLGELLKLSIRKPVSGAQGAELVLASPGQLKLACRLLGSAAIAYYALNDLPLLFKKVIDAGFDVAPDTLIDLRDLASGGTGDLLNDLHEAAWQTVRGKPSGLKSWQPGNVKMLKAYIATHWKESRKAYLLMPGSLESEAPISTYDEVAKDLSLGLVVRDAGGLNDLMSIDEENLVVLVVEYLELLETL